MLEAVIFDLDGTLVDSEQYGHRVAFNDAFEALGLPDRWPQERYRGLLATTGGERRLIAWLSSPESSFFDRPEPEQRTMAKSLHRWKTDRVEAMAAAGEIPAREGVGRWLEELEGAGVRLAVATTGSRQWAVPLLDKAFGADRFEIVVAGDDVARRKPEPDAYLLALSRLGIDHTEAVAVEDSGPGWESARAAGLVCLIVANAETNLETVADAPLIIDGFGPPWAVTKDRFDVMKSDDLGALGPTNVLARLAARDHRDVIFDGFSHQLPDTDPEETAEWVDSFDAVLDAHGKSRARFLLMKLLERARAQQVGFPATVSTPYVNTIPPDQEPWFPGDEYVERRIRAYIRWNAAVMVVRANNRAEGIGGHLATFASSASLYEVGFNHFFQGKDNGQSGDQVFFQGHAAPGIYARAFLEGRLSEGQLDNFRTEVTGAANGTGGLSSYPHPRLMPEFWEFPTVSMGLGPLNAIYQAHFNRYLRNRRIADTSGSRVWCFVGDGECDEPETLGALSLAARENLDNLTFVINCNLQRLDGPVRGNGKIIQELEAVFRGAGWNVIKVIWGSKWDELLARDVDGVLLNRMNASVDGEYQQYATHDGEYIREHFFGPDPRLRKIVEHLSDDDLRNLPRGGHDYHKLYAAYKAATETTGQPTVILAHTIKGWTLGPEIEGRNATHQIKKMTKAQLAVLRDRLHLQDEIPDAALDAKVPPFFRPAHDSVEYQYMMQRRRALGGPLPRRTPNRATPLDPPDDKVFDEFKSGSGTRAVSTTVAFAGLLRNLLRDRAIGRRIVPIIPDEARTFGLDALFREIKIYAPGGQLYDPVDSQLTLSYTEAKDGQILEEGITEAGSMADFTAAGTAYATHGAPMIPFFMFYSMFGFQRVGDMIWAFGDVRGRGFLMGATAGRTTLTGEGLQHDDGHSLVLASTVPNLRAYDPAFAYETAAIVKDGIARMFCGPKPEDIFYYLTLYNENFVMPAAPVVASDEEALDSRIVRGIYRFSAAPDGPTRRATILFSGTGSQAALEAQKLLAAQHDVGAELWSVTSYKALREEALGVERHNRLHPHQPPGTPYLTSALASCEGPVVAVTDYMKMVPDQVARWIPGHFTPLGTDGFGRSDTRAALRRHFETDAAHVVVAVLDGLRATGDAKSEEVADAIAAYHIDAEAPNPLLL